MNIKSLLPKIVTIINEYGIDVTILRDVYENEVGVKTLQDKGVLVCKVKAVIDNSKSSSNVNNAYKVNGIVKPQGTATVYVAYDKSIDIQNGDYFIIDGLRYTLSLPQDLLHYHLLYQYDAEVNINE